MAKSWYLISFAILVVVLIVASALAAGLSEGVAKGIYVVILITSICVLGVTVWRLTRPKG